MGLLIGSVTTIDAQFSAFSLSSQTSTSQPVTTKTGDVLQLGASSISLFESSNIVLERAFEQLRAVVSDARAELGIPEDTTLDLSPEATAGRIADFALGFFGNFLDNHPELDGDGARAAFVDLIGPAIEQGISEARGILGALSALSGETTGLIDSISSIVQERLDAFLANG